MATKRKSDLPNAAQEPHSIQGIKKNTTDDKIEIFAREYIIHMNASRAYAACGHSEKTAEKNAWKFLIRPDVQQRIIELKNERIKRLQIDGDRVLQELAAVGLADYGTYQNWSNGVVNTQDSTELDTRAIQSVKVIRQTFGDEGETITQEIKLHDKVKALIALGEHFGVLKSKTSLLDDAAGVIAAMNEGINLRMKEGTQNTSEAKKE